MKREYGIGMFCYETIRRPNSAGGKDCADVTLFSKGQTFEVTSAALNEKVLSSNLQINIHSPLLSRLIRVRQVTRIVCRNFTFFLSSSSLFLWECFTWSSVVTTIWHFVKVIPWFLLSLVAIWSWLKKWPIIISRTSFF